MSERDIVERLTMSEPVIFDRTPVGQKRLMREAADEIERLRGERDDYQASVANLAKTCLLARRIAAAVQAAPCECARRVLNQPCQLCRILAAAALADDNMTGD